MQNVIWLEGRLGHDRGTEPNLLNARQRRKFDLNANLPGEKVIRAIWGYMGATWGPYQRATRLLKRSLDHSSCHKFL